MNRNVFITLGVIYIDIHRGSSYMEVTPRFYSRPMLFLRKTQTQGWTSNSNIRNDIGLLNN